MAFSRQGSWRLATLMLTPLLLVGCSKPEARRETPKPTVEVVRPVERAVMDKEVFTGRLESTGWVQVRSRVTGYLKRYAYTEGGKVKADDLLFEIDPRPYEAEMARAAALLAQADARLARLTHDHERAMDLLPRRAISREEADRIAGDRTEAQAAVGVARANLKLAELNLTYTKIIANQDGWVGRRMVEPGNLIKADDTVLAHVMDMVNLYVHFDVDERTVLRIKRLIQAKKMKSHREGTVQVRVGLADEEPDRYSLTGEIDYADNHVDGGTGTLRVRATIKNTNLLLAPGMFVRVQLDVGEATLALLVPEEAISTDQDRKVIYLVDTITEKGADGQEVTAEQAQAIQVEVGPSERGLAVVRQDKDSDGKLSETRFCVVKSLDPKRPLKPDDRVIVRGLQRVRDKIKVTTKLLPVEEVKSEEASGAKRPAP